MQDKRFFSNVDITVQTMPNVIFAELMASVLAKGAPFRFTAAGLSMSPFINDGDVITIAPMHKRIRFGEVVAFLNKCNDRLTVHRVVQISSNGYLIQGDNILEPDGYVSRANILGRVICVEHRGKRVRFGMGIERIVIAYLSRRNWLMPLVNYIQSLRRIIFKVFLL